MAGAIGSELGAAQEKRAELLSALGEYATLSLGSAAALSDGTPPADHDARASALAAALSGYAEALGRDADAFERIGIAFEGDDLSLASAILGIGAAR